jgi:phosphatidate cytidylyltransferase
MVNESENKKPVVTSEEDATVNNTLPHKHHEIQINKLSEANKKSMSSRMIVAVIAIPIALLGICLGEYVYAAMIFVLALLATHEIIKAPQSIERKFSNAVNIFSYIMMVLLVFWIFASNNIVRYTGDSANYYFSIYKGFNIPVVSLSAFAVCMVFFFATVLFDSSFSIHDAFYFITMLFVVSVGFQSLLFLRYYPITTSLLDSNAVLSNPRYMYGESATFLIYFGLGTLGCDAGAYFIGVFFGKHHMAPLVSPKKTWEGFVGGVVISAILTMTFAFVLSGTGHEILNILNLDHWYYVVVLSLLMPVASTFGDLLFSSVKRGFKVKDFGKAFGAHGGVLDRLDSVLITAILVSLVIPLFEGIERLFAA